MESEWKPRDYREFDETRRRIMVAAAWRGVSIHRLDEFVGGPPGAWRSNILDAPPLTDAVIGRVAESLGIERDALKSRAPLDLLFIDPEEPPFDTDSRRATT